MVRSLVLVMVVGLVAADVAAAGATPDAEQLAALRARLASTSVVRVHGSFGIRELGNPVLDSSGVRSRDWAERAQMRPALFVAANAKPEPEPAPIPWSEITAMRVPLRSSGVLKGFVLGAVTGIALGAMLASATRDPHDAGEAAGYRSIGMFTGSVVLGAGAGVLIGSAHGWSSVYESESH